MTSEKHMEKAREIRHLFWKSRFEPEEVNVLATALADAEREGMKRAVEIRTGDTVYHMPSGEQWLVAWADHSSGYMAPCGWPECQAKIADCALLKKASDDECRKLASSLSTSGRRDAKRASAILSEAKEGE